MSGSARNPSRRKLLCDTAALALGGISTANAGDLDVALDGTKKILWPVLDLVGGGNLYPKDWVGVAAIVVFWATWCPYCKRHNAAVNRLFHALDDQRVRILGVATGDTEAQVIAYARSNALDFPIALGSPSLKLQFSSRSVIPLTCLVRSDGSLLQVIPGEMARDDVASLPSLLVAQAK